MPEPFGIVDRFIAVSRIVADPPLINLCVVAWLDAIDDALVVLHVDVFAAGISGADGGGRFEKPDALLEEKILVQESTDGAKIHDVAREFVVQGLAGKDVDLLLVPAA